MYWIKPFVSFRGRINRARFWLVSLTWMAYAAVLDYAWTATGASEVAVGTNHFVAAVFVLVVVPPIASCLAVSVTRLHDRNKSAWWLLLFGLCPLAMETIASLRDLDSAPMVILMILSRAISLWALVEFGCLPGTAGPNRYGPDPLTDGLLPST
jgi:uncharacterized membrane protein YhaH (DUF805 family)